MFPKSKVLQFNYHSSNVKINRLSILTKLLIIVIGFSSFLPEKAKAQISSDGTLPTKIEKSSNVFEITDGAKAGNNLFHSFQEFSLPTGFEAFFNNAANIENIFSRITGDSVSIIDGLIRANGNTNLFFLNPNGIVFGENARLDLGGSFIATTADRIEFADGTSFAARGDEPKVSLTLVPPVGINFIGYNGSITVNGQGHNLIDPPFAPLQQANSNSDNGLQVQPNRLLGLVGSEIILNGGILTAEGGRIELGSVDRGTVSVDRQNSDLVFDYTEVNKFQNIELLSESLVNTSGQGSNSVQVSGANIKLLDGSSIWLQNRGNQFSQDITISASESLEVNGRNSTLNFRSGIYSETISGGRGADLKIFTSQLLLSDAGVISASTSNFGDGGNLEINTQELRVSGGANLATATLGDGDGGDLNIQSKEKVEVIGFSSLFPNFFSAIASNTGGKGKGGNLNMETPLLLLQDTGSILTSVVNSEGQGGNITLNVSELTELNNEIDSVTKTAISSATFGSGNAGSITLNTNELIIQDNSTIEASTFADGNAGELLINVIESARIDGATINSSAEEPPPEISQLIGLDTDLTGDADKITFNSPKIEIINAGEISVRNQGSGNAGELGINAESIFLDNASRITASTLSGEGGNITLETGQLLLQNNSLISTSAGGFGNGGNITINSDTFTALDNSKVTANAVRGNGGNILINTKGYFVSDDFIISATSEFGLDGKVEINISEEDLGATFVPKTPPLISLDEVLAKSCLTAGGRARNATRINVFGKGGLPMNPYHGIDEGEGVTSPPDSEPTTKAYVYSDREPQPGDPLIQVEKIIPMPDGRLVGVAELEIKEKCLD